MCNVTHTFKSLALAILTTAILNMAEAIHTMVGAILTMAAAHARSRRPPPPAARDTSLAAPVVRVRVRVRDTSPAAPVVRVRGRDTSLAAPG